MSEDDRHHKRKFRNFISPEYSYNPNVDSEKVNEKFQKFFEETLDMIPDNPAPADVYMYATWSGEFARLFDESKDAFVKALYAYYEERGSKKKE